MDDSERDAIRARVEESASVSGLLERQVHADRAALLAENDALREAFGKFGWHVSTCAAWDIEEGVADCDCGFEDAYSAFVSPTPTEGENDE